MIGQNGNEIEGKAERVSRKELSCIYTKRWNSRGMEVVCGEGHVTTDCYATEGELGEIVMNDRKKKEYYLPVSPPSLTIGHPVESVPGYWQLGQRKGHSLDGKAKGINPSSIFSVVHGTVFSQHTEMPKVACLNLNLS